MAKPDLQKVYVKPTDGNLRRLDGKLGLGLVFANLTEAANDSAADTAGVPVGGVYRTAAGVVHVRLT